MGRAAWPEHMEIFNLDAVPDLEAIGDSLRIRLIWLEPTKLVAFIATLMIDPSIISSPAIKANRSGNGSAWPSLSST